MKLYEVMHKTKVYMGEFEHDENARIYTRKKYKHQWLNKDGEKWYFKAREPKTEIYLGDIVAPYIFEKVGFQPDDYLMYYLVEMEDENGKVTPGVLSKNYIHKNEFQFSYYDVALFSYCIDNNIDYRKIRDDKLLGKEETSKIQDFEKTFKENPGQYLVSVDDMLSDLKRFCEWNGFDCDYDDVEFKLKRMIISDFFLCQCDRHRGNTEFKMKHGKVTMCPIFDHEHCLAIDMQGQAYNMKKYPLYTGFSSVGAYKDNQKQTAENIMKSHILNKEEIAKSLLENTDFMNNSRLFKNNNLMACDIIAECLNNKKLADVTYNFLNLDIENVLCKFEQEYAEINPFLKDCMVSQYNIMREKFASTFNTISQHFSTNKNKKFDALQQKFSQPLEKINKKMEKQQEESEKLRKNAGKLSKEDEDLLKFL